MSQANVERLRRSYEAFNASQETDLDLWASDIEYIQTADVGAGETVYRGREGVARRPRYARTRVVRGEVSGNF